MNALGGNSLLFGAALIEQLGVPFPASPMFIAAGVMAGTSRLAFAAGLGAAVLGSLMGDLVWYELARTQGPRVLNFLSKGNADAAQCAIRAEATFSKHGAIALLLGKFIPGVSIVSRPMAALAGLRPSRFLAYDGVGTLLYIGSFMTLGAFFHDGFQDAIAWFQVNRGPALIAASSAAAILAGLKFAHIAIAPKWQKFFAFVTERVHS